MSIRHGLGVTYIFDTAFHAKNHVEICSKTLYDNRKCWEFACESENIFRKPGCSLG